MGTLGVVIPVPHVRFPSGAIVNVEIAHTAHARARGLMFRAHLDDGAGMLMVLDGPAKVRSIWMHNVRFPLDVIFLRRAKDKSKATVVGILQDVPPLNKNPRRVDAPSDLVLEVNAGFVARAGVEVGEAVTVSI